MCSSFHFRVQKDRRSKHCSEMLTCHQLNITIRCAICCACYTICYDMLCHKFPNAPNVDVKMTIFDTVSISDSSQSESTQAVLRKPKAPPASPVRAPWRRFMLFLSWFYQLSILVTVFYVMLSYARFHFIHSNGVMILAFWTSQIDLRISMESKGWCSRLQSANVTKASRAN